jgi:HK97 family phage major capsid protein
MTRAFEAKLERCRALIAEQRTYLDETVPVRVAENPKFDYRTDRHYVERQHEIDRLSRETDNPGSGAGREPTSYRISDGDGGLGGSQMPASHSPAFDRRSSWEQDQCRALSTLFRGGPNVIESDHRGILERASLSTASGAVGGYLIPNFIQQSVIQDLAKFQTVRRLGASTIPLRGKENLPMINDPEAGFITEADATSTGMSQTDPTFSQIEIRPELVYATTNYSWHVQSFSPANVEEEIRRCFGRAIAKTTAQKYLTGSGTNQPQGVVTGAGLGVTAAAVDEFTALEISNLWYSLDPWFQMDSSWIVSPDAAAHLRTLETSQGQPLVAPDWRDGIDRLFGRPLVTDPFMPDHGGRRAAYHRGLDERVLPDRGESNFRGCRSVLAPQVR